MSVQMKVLISVCLIAAMVSVMLAGCTSNTADEANKENNVETNTGSTDASPVTGDDTTSVKETAGGLEVPFADGTTLTFATFENYYADASLTSGLEVWKRVEERTGVKMEFQVAPSSEYDNYMMVRMAAGNLPDILRVPESAVVKYAGQGLFEPMNELIEQHAPNIKRFFEENPDLASLFTLPDGSIYGISSITTGSGMSDPSGLMIRQDWLDRLGLKEPTTIDEWYIVLKAFKEQDPNGNGLADEIPLSPKYALWGLGVFSSGFGLHQDWDDLYSVDANGKIHYELETEQAKAYYQWLNKLFREGLLDPEFTNENAEQFNGKITRNLVGATNHAAQNTERYNGWLKEAGVEDAVYVMNVPPANNGQKGYYEKYGPNSGWFSIAKNSNNKVEAIKLLDYIYASEEGNYLFRLGIEGKTYEWVDGKPVWTEWVTSHPDGLSSAQALRSIGALPTTPWIFHDKGFHSLNPQNSEFLAAQSEKLKDYLDEGVYFGLPTLEEADELAAIQADTDTHRDEQLIRFMLGDRDFSEWDQFNRELVNMGIERVHEVMQARYDRYSNAMEQFQ